MPKHEAQRAQIASAIKKSEQPYFDAECQNRRPSTFVPDNGITSGASALSQFMSKAVDLQSAFKYAESISEQQPSGSTTEVQLQPVEIDSAPVTAADNEPARPSPAVCASLEQASVLKDPQEISGTTSIVEKDAGDRVIRSFLCGEYVCFEYDEAGELAEFNYAGMQWTRAERGWAARDRHTEYSVDGRISVLENGSIRVEREDVVRTLKLSGTRIDEHKSGSRTESRKLRNKPSPYDLLARAKAVNSIWLNPSFKASGDQTFPSPLKLDLSNEFVQTAQEKVFSPAQSKAAQAEAKEASPICQPPAPAESRSPESTDKPKAAEDRLECPKEKSPRVNPRQHLQECFLKSRLWLTDRIVGQSSPKHLAQLDRLAQMYLERQRDDLAELTHMRALHIREQFYGKGQPELAISIHALAGIYEQRGNFARAEELYKEAIQLQENGLRKILFLYSEKVTDAARLGSQLDQIFGSVADLSRLYSIQGRPQLCAVVLEKAMGLAAEIVEREPAAELVLANYAHKHLVVMNQFAAV